MAEMILNHHKVTRYRGSTEWLVEDAGFHKRLLQLELTHIRKHPLDPLPVFRF